MKNTNILRRIFCILLMTIITLFIIFFTNRHKNQDISVISNSGYYFDTFITISIYESNSSQIDADKALITQCFELCEKYELIFSQTNENSELYRLNHSLKPSVTVSDELFKVLSISKEYNTITDGAFNILIGSLSSLWNFKNKTIPENSTVLKELNSLKMADYNLYNNSVIFNGYKNEFPEITLGGIAKGYIADRLKEFLITGNVTSAIINLGGNILLIGEKPDSKPFNIGITKPFTTTGESLANIILSDMSVVTSGIYQRYFEKNGKIYHHIINPSTGYPVENNLYSVTIISPSSTTADILSTAVYVMGPQKGMELINNTENVYGIFVTSDFEIILSDGLTQNENDIFLTSN